MSAARSTSGCDQCSLLHVGGPLTTSLVSLRTKDTTLRVHGRSADGLGDTNGSGHRRAARCVHLLETKRVALPWGSVGGRPHLIYITRDFPGSLNEITSTKIKKINKISIDLVDGCSCVREKVGAQYVVFEYSVCKAPLGCVGPVVGWAHLFNDAVALRHKRAAPNHAGGRRNCRAPSDPLLELLTC